MSASCVKLTEEFIVNTSLRVTVWVLLATFAASAQTALDANRLPSATVFYLHWRGAAAAQPVAATNPVVVSWSDPDFLSFRNGLLAELREEFSAKRTGINVSLQELLPLFRTPLVLGATTAADPNAEADSEQKAASPQSISLTTCFTTRVESKVGFESCATPCSPRTQVP